MSGNDDSPRRRTQIPRARREWHRNDHAGDAGRTHLVRLPDRTLVRADRYIEALIAWEERAIAAGELDERDRPSTRVPRPR